MQSKKSEDSRQIAPYTIQQWLFDEANGRFDLDLGESGIQHHYIHDLEIKENYDLNYCADRGSLQLRQQIADMYGAGPENVAITNGSQEALFLYYQCFVEAGDEVITLVPGWQQSWEVPIHRGARLSKVRLLPENGYRIDWGAVRRAISSKTRLLILTFPNNPTGTALSPDDRIEIEKIMAEFGIAVLNDEEYVTDYSQSLWHSGPGGRVAVVSSLSKIYGFPGLRMGWIIAQQDVIEKVVNMKRYTTVCNSSLSERLAQQVLERRDAFVSRYRRLRDDGLAYLARWIEGQDILELVRPEGTPFAYIKLRARASSMEFCRSLLQRHRVLIMPGEVFEDQCALRLSFGRELSVLEDGLARVDDFIRSTY